MKVRSTFMAPLDALRTNHSNPRDHISEDSVLGLAETLKHGQLTPIVVTRVGEHFLILDGHRRYHAAPLAGLTALLAIEVDAPTPDRALQDAFVRNTQRADLSPIERAKTVESIIKGTGCQGSPDQVHLQFGQTGPP